MSSARHGRPGPGETRPLRVAVVGAGPSGVYTVEALLAQQTVRVSVDVLDRLPTPFGLVRYGVAPDHHKIRSVRTTLERLLELPGVRVLGNVEVGATARPGNAGAALTLGELREHVDAVVYSYGAARDRRLGVPGEDLAGSIAATDFVAWYCGTPDGGNPDGGTPDGGNPDGGTPDGGAADVPYLLRTTRAAVVVGVGNVAVDVARVLAKSRPELAGTDMPELVLQTLASCPVTDVHVLGRRGPAQAAFTTKELRELGQLDDVAVVVDPRDLELDPVSAAVVAGDRAVRRNLEVLQGWAAAPRTGGGRRLHLRFWSRPVELVGADRVTGVVVERTALDAGGAARGTGVFTTVPAELVVRSVGYRGVALDGLPFDAAAGVVPSQDGRVLRDGVVSPGEYVAGWIKRGPTGVIGTNRHDAADTVASVLADVPTLPPARRPDPAALTDLLAGRGVRVLGMDDWHRIDAAEVALGGTRGRDRTTLHEQAALLAAADLRDGGAGRA